MGISTALNNALSGLNAAGRGAEVVSSNVANVATPGYARRSLALSSQDLGGKGAGVQIDGITREVNRFLVQDRRLIEGGAANARGRAEYFKRIEKAIGLTGDTGALTEQISAFDSALIQAASRPDSEARLQTVLSSANAIAAKLRDLTATVQSARQEADLSIGTQVASLNERLARVDALNSEIIAQKASGNDAAGLEDQRRVVIDEIARIVPVREAVREEGRVSLYTNGGAVLLEGNPVEISFTPAGFVAAHLVSGSGLSQLTIGGQIVPTGEQGVIGGGTLASAFAVRDTLAPETQIKLDALARDIIERFEASGVDPTALPGAPGLFTDAGSPLNPLQETGLAGRISVTAEVDPARGGKLWRLRDGLGATIPGQVGDAAQLNRFGRAITDPRVPASGGFIGGARSASGLFADVLSGVASGRQQAEDLAAYSEGKRATLAETEAAQGVDTDAELQAMMLIEQSFAANARVIKTLDDLLAQLIGL